VITLNSTETIIGELIEKNLFIPAFSLFLLGIFIYWIVVHCLAEPGSEIKLLWGLAHYRKKGDLLVNLESGDNTTQKFAGRSIEINQSLNTRAAHKYRDEFYYQKDRSTRSHRNENKLDKIEPLEIVVIKKISDLTQIGQSIIEIIDRMQLSPIDRVFEGDWAARRPENSYFFVPSMMLIGDGSCVNRQRMLNEPLAGASVFCMSTSHDKPIYIMLFFSETDIPRLNSPEISNQQYQARTVPDELFSFAVLFNCNAIARIDPRPNFAKSMAHTFDLTLRCGKD
jgi:hypothetical protein